MVVMPAAARNEDGGALRSICRRYWRRGNQPRALLGDDAAVLARPRGEERATPAIEQASRRWRGGGRKRIQHERSRKILIATRKLLESNAHAGDLSTRATAQFRISTRWRWCSRKAKTRGFDTQWRSGVVAAPDGDVACKDAEFRCASVAGVGGGGEAAAAARGVWEMRRQHSSCRTAP